MTKSPSPQIDRRTVVRTAAWGVPLVTVASHSPAFANSGAACPLIRSSPGAFNATAVVVNNVGVVGFVGALSIDASGVPTQIFVDGFVFVVNSASITMSNGSTYPASVGVGAGVATSSLLPVPLPAGIVFEGVPFRSGVYGNTGLTNNFRPRSVQANVTMTFVTLTGPDVECTYDLTWPVETVVGAGAVAALTGAGTITYTGTVGSLPARGTA